MMMRFLLFYTSPLSSCHDSQNKSCSAHTIITSPGLFHLSLFNISFFNLTIFPAISFFSLPSHSFPFLLCIFFLNFSTPLRFTLYLQPPNLHSAPSEDMQRSDHAALPLFQLFCCACVCV